MVVPEDAKGSSFRHFQPTKWTLDNVLQWRVGLTPDAPFLSFADAVPESFAEIHRHALEISCGLASTGVALGDRVILFAGNSVEIIKIWFAINLIGATDVPINPAFKGAPLEHAVKLIDATAVIVERPLLPVLRDISSSFAPGIRIFWFGSGECSVESIGQIPVRPLFDLPKRSTGWTQPAITPSDLGSILFTSGTTGPSKGVMLTHAQAFLTALQTAEGLQLSESDVVYCAHPLFHMSPRYCAIYAALLTGAMVCVDERFSAQDWIDRIRQTGATVTIGHGPLLEMIYNQPERPDDAQTRLTRVGTSPFPKHIAADFERRFGVKGIETWGMTEINIPCWHPFDEPLRTGSCGKIRTEWYDFRVVDPETDNEVQTGQIGEFVVRPKLPWILSPGYFRNPEATLKAWRNLWFHSGDSGFVDADGWVYFVDRLGDRIRRRAENISSYDIELAANSHPAILESAAIGVLSDFASDDDVKLCVVLRDGFVLDELVLLEFLAKALPHHMLPRYIERLESLPRTPTQKVGKGQLRLAGITAGTWDRKQHDVDIRILSDRSGAG